MRECCTAAIGTIVAPIHPQAQAHTMKPFPKSLHTVAVLVAMAKVLIDNGIVATRVAAVQMAFEQLGYSDADTPDPYQLKAQAVSKLARLGVGL